MTKSSERHWIWLTRIALAIAIVVVIARATMLEYIREPFDPVPGEAGVGRGPGPTTALALDLLAAAPALLVALRATFDGSFHLRRSWGNVVMLLLGVCVVAGAYRGDDRFAAVVGAANVVGALALLWGTQQLVRSWRQVRIIAAVAFGLLLVYCAHAVIDKTVEMPVRRQNIERNKNEMLRQMGMEPGTYEAERFMKKVTGGELLGFSASINTFAAVLVTLGLISAGAAVQRLRDGAEPAGAVVVGIGLGVAAVVVYWTDSRTALATPVLGAILLGGVAALGGVLAKHRRLAFGAAVACGFALIALLIARGLSTGNLFHDSLTFRWRYWVGAYQVWLERPLLGVGFDSFQFHYLAHRLPIAAEEVKDPHNFLVRAFAELGVIGGLLTIVWVIKGLFDMTSPATLPADAGRPPVDESSYSDLGRIATVCAGGMILGFIANNDWQRIDWNISMDALKRLLYVCLLTIGAAVVALKSLQEQSIDGRPAPWIRWAMTVGVILFLVHNLVDFAMFETSAMYVAALIAGTAWGVGLPAGAESRAVSAARFGGGMVVAGAAVVAWLGPMALAESAADDGDAALRARQFATANQHYRAAWSYWPTNPDYAHRAVRALAFGHGPPDAIRRTIDAAIAANPMDGKYWLTRAQFESQQPQPDVEAVRDAYEQVLQLDPANVQRRLEYADVLVRLGQPGEAKKQYQLALDFNDRLHPDEPKRLRAKKLAEIHKKLSRL